MHTILGSCSAGLFDEDYSSYKYFEGHISEDEPETPRKEGEHDQRISWRLTQSEMIRLVRVKLVLEVEESSRLKSDARPRGACVTVESYYTYIATNTRSVVFLLLGFVGCTFAECWLEVSLRERAGLHRPQIPPELREEPDSVESDERQTASDQEAEPT